MDGRLQQARRAIRSSTPHVYAKASRGTSCTRVGLHEFLLSIAASESRKHTSVVVDQVEFVARSKISSQRGGMFSVSRAARQAIKPHSVRA